MNDFTQVRRRGIYIQWFVYWNVKILIEHAPQAAGFEVHAGDPFSTARRPTALAPVRRALSGFGSAPGSANITKRCSQRSARPRERGVPYRKRTRYFGLKRKNKLPDGGTALVMTLLVPSLVMPLIGVQLVKSGLCCNARPVKRAGQEILRPPTEGVTVNAGVA
jgi:hypothetical protein